jgi:NAD+ synthetase
VAALCVRALGAPNVRGVMMPSRYSSDHSLADARAAAAALGMRQPDLLPIAPAHELLARSIGGVEPLQGLADENLQSRLRGLTLMALSNATGAMVVSTGNKSELAVGYATLYGDMCGGIAPIGDLTKGQVYALARWMNDHHVQAGFERPPVPEGSIAKPPSAELRPDQRDQDTLPPYDELDAIVHGFVDLEQSPHSIALSTGLEESVVRRWCLAIDRAQYKREQAGVVPKISMRAFGPGRRLPLAMRES